MPDRSVETFVSGQRDNCQKMYRTEVFTALGSSGIKSLLITGIICFQNWSNGYPSPGLTVVHSLCDVIVSQLF